MKYLVFIILFLFLFLPLQAWAETKYSNNKFGIHLATPDDGDLDRAEELINSSGGTWGYVTLVIQENDFDLNKWQGVFDKLREQRIIPIIRIATKPDGSNWRRPDKSDAQSWVDFLNKLRWVVKNRYIVLFNEPNHATEWGGKVDAQNYAEVAKEFANKLKGSNKDYFIMLAGMDASAPSQIPNYEDEEKFLTEVIEKIDPRQFNRQFDGLASHSYPNPGFVGSPYAQGRGTIRGYEWELSLLNSIGVKELPVFITETGWHGEAISRQQVAQNFRIAYYDVWLPDDRVFAVTPFILNYQTEPFLKFSWVRPQNVGVYPEFNVIKGMQKERGVPEIEESGRFTIDLPKELVAKSSYHFQIELENTGQAIWRADEDYSVKIKGLPESQYLVSPIERIKPFESKILDIYITTYGVSENASGFLLNRGKKIVLKSEPWNFEVVPLPKANLVVTLLPKVITSGEDFELQIFDKQEQMVFRKSKIEITNSKGIVEEVENIALGQRYRVVVIKKYYLPRQTYVTFQKGTNEIVFEPMLPIDFSGDGAAGWDDIPALFSDFRKAGLLLVQ